MFFTISFGIIVNRKKENEMKLQTMKSKQLKEKEIEFALVEMDEIRGEFDGDPLIEMPMWAWDCNISYEFQKAEDERRKVELEEEREIEMLMAMSDYDEPDSLPSNWALSFGNF